MRADALLVSLCVPIAAGYSLACGSKALALAPQHLQRPARAAMSRMEAAAAAVSLESSGGGGDGSGDGEQSEDWSVWLRRPRAARLRDIALSISVRRTVDEAELALKLSKDYESNPSLLEDIDFNSLMRRLQTDIDENDAPLRASALLSDAELAEIYSRQLAAIADLEAARPPEVFEQPDAVAAAVPKLRRLISNARELPLTIELPSAIQGEDGIDFRLALNESKNLGSAVKVCAHVLTCLLIGCGLPARLASRLPLIAIDCH